MTEIFTPRRTRNPIDWRGVPASYKDRLSAVCRTAQECGDLVAWFGDAEFCPFLPVLVMVPGVQPVLIAGLGYATAAELQDCAVYTWAHQLQMLARYGAALDFDARREAYGLMRREDVDAAVREALVARIARHRANPVTDPFRQPNYPRIGGRRIFVVNEEQGHERGA